MIDPRIRISVIVPTYNAAAWLDECLTSVTSQLPQDCELILVDDGSSDGTAQAICRYAQGRSNVSAVLCAHGGVSSARNTGMRAAKGKYLAFLDCDDCLKESYFTQSLRLIESDADLYIGGFERVESETETPVRLTDQQYETVSDFADEYIRNRKLLVYSACNKFFRNSIIKAHDIRFEEGLSFGEDRLFVFEYLRYCGRIETTSMILFRYMQRNPHSASKRLFPDHEELMFRLHRAKMECFLNLSKGTTKDEKDSFVQYDLEAERERYMEKISNDSKSSENAGH